jgi:hypothetical protein
MNMPVNHEIVVSLRNDGKDERPALPKTLPPIKVGDTVRYVAPQGRNVVIEFPDPSPFESTKISANSGPHTVLREGRFECRCFIVKENGEKVGWDLQNPDAGGVHDVGHGL